MMRAFPLRSAACVNHAIARPNAAALVGAVATMLSAPNQTGRDTSYFQRDALDLSAIA